MALFDAVADLPLTVDGYGLERRCLEVSSGFVRVTTTVVLEGGGERGVGEDVAWDETDHEGYPDDLDLAGPRTLAGWSERLDGADLFPRPPERGTEYRRWAFESAGLDLALRQAGISLGEAVGRACRPVQFVLSTRLDVRPWLAVDPTLEFKLDPTSDWSREEMDAIAATDRVRVLDFKGYYEGTWVDQAPDPDLYGAVAETFPAAILEDPAWNEDTAAALAGQEGRISFDAPVHSVADLDGLPFEPRWLNVKPSRFGRVEEVLACIEACEARGIACYGGGQFELGPGRRQIQALASLFYPDGPNDVAPVEYHAGGPRPGLARSPLPPPPGGAGFAPRG